MKKLFILLSLICVAPPAQAFLGEKVRRVEPKAACAALKVKSKTERKAYWKKKQIDEKWYGEMMEIIALKKNLLSEEEYKKWSQEANSTTYMRKNLVEEYSPHYQTASELSFVPSIPP